MYTDRETCGGASPALSPASQVGQVFYILHEVPKGAEGADGEGWRAGIPCAQGRWTEACSDPEVWPGEGPCCLPEILLCWDEIQAAGKKQEEIQTAEQPSRDLQGTAGDTMGYRAGLGGFSGIYRVQLGTLAATKSRGCIKMDNIRVDNTKMDNIRADDVRIR